MLFLSELRIVKEQLALLKNEGHEWEEGDAARSEVFNPLLILRCVCVASCVCV